MALETDIAVLSGAPLFCLLDRQPLRLIAFAAETRVLPRGADLFRKGDRSDGGYVVTEGAVALDPGDGSAAFVAEPGAVIGRAALFTRIVRPATATAREPSAVMRITPALMRRVLEEFPAAAAVIHDVIAAEVASLTEELERMRERFFAFEGESVPTPAQAFPIGNTLARG